MPQGKFLMIDGLDGSGKGVAIKALTKYLEDQGKKIFSLHDYWRNVNNIPELDEVMGYDVIVSSEPTFSMVGRVIREEIVRENNRKYSALSTAHAFALDREILYRKLLIPAKKAGKIILQERGVVTSLVYQPIQLERINMKDILNLPGNRLAVRNAPDILVITKVEPMVVMQRLKTREKKDHAIFENIHFQRQIQARYESDWLGKLFSQFSSTIEYIDTNPPKTEDDTKDAIIAVWNKVR